MDAAPIFEPSEHVFDLVALLVEAGVIGDGSRRDGSNFGRNLAPLTRFGRPKREPATTNAAFKHESPLL